jgi:hypothetical protein
MVAVFHCVEWQHLTFEKQQLVAHAIIEEQTVMKADFITNQTMLDVS